MHKGLAQAWRDLKQEGQKPYFDEYDRAFAQYQKWQGEMKDARAQAEAQAKRAASATSSLPPGSAYDGAQSPAPGSGIDDEAEDHKDNMSDSVYMANK